MGIFCEAMGSSVESMNDGDISMIADEDGLVKTRSSEDSSTRVVDVLF